MTAPRARSTGRVANWRGQVARVQQYYEEGEKFFSKAKNVLIVVAVGKYLGMTGWALYLAAPAIMAGIVVGGWCWVRLGWYAHATEIGVLERWTPFAVWDMWMRVRLYEKLGLELNHTPTDRLPDAVTSIMASTRTRP